MDEETEKHQHVVSMDLDDKACRRESMIASGALGLFVATVVFGLCGWVQRRTFDATHVTFEEEPTVTIIEENE